MSSCASDSAAQLDSPRSTRSGAHGQPAIDYEQHPGAATTPLSHPQYQRHEPEKTVLYQIVQENLETFLARPSFNGGPGYPRFIEREFRHYLDCGILALGFSRVRCPKCGFERLVAYSCKGHMCPSCNARRTHDLAARLVDDLLPAVPYRQWVLSFPFDLRHRLARHPKFLGKMLAAFLGIIFAWQRHRGRALGITDGQTGAITFLQRFGGALNLNPHAHCVLPDGLFTPRSASSGPGPLAFIPLHPPTDEEIALLTRRIARRLTALARHTFGEDGEELPEEDEEQAVLSQDLAISLLAPHGSPEEETSGGRSFPSPDKPLCAMVQGFSLHAARTVDEDDREGLERLCCYGLRSPFSMDRLSLLPDGRVAYELKRPWSSLGGATHLKLDPLEFLRRLAALIPAPYLNMVRYHGVFANRSRWRSQMPAPPRVSIEELAVEAEAAANRDQEIPGAAAPGAVPSALESLTQIPRPRRIAWATLLRRVFGFDPMICPRCLTPMVVLAFITDPKALVKILQHLDLPTSPPPIAPVRLPVEIDLSFEEQPSDDEGCSEKPPAKLGNLHCRQSRAAPL